MSEPTPTTLDGFTPTWLTAALRATGTIDADTSVSSVDYRILGTGEGFMGELARLRLGYAGGSGPATMIAKIPTQIEQNRALGKSLGLYEREVRIYGDLLPSLPTPAPEVYAAIYEAAGDEADIAGQAEKAEKLPVWVIRLILKRQASDSDVPPAVLLLEDLAARAEVGDQVAGLPLHSIEDSLRAIARLHAATWNRAGIPDEHWVWDRSKSIKLSQAIYLNGRKETATAIAPYMSEGTLDLLKSVKKTGVARLRRMFAEQPQCLQHGDYRPDNMFFHEDGRLASVIDWQGTNVGPAIFDVLYFLLSSIEVDDPDAHVDDLMRVYHDELVANGVDDYPFEQMMEHYEEMLLIFVHGMPLLVANVDFGDGRGVELLAGNLRRFESLLQRIDHTDRPPSTASAGEPA